MVHFVHVYCVVALVTSACHAQNFRIFFTAWFTQGDDILRSDDVFSSYMVIPMAIEHFNERRNSVIPQLANLSDCNATLSLTDGVMIDGQGSPNIGMTQFVRKYSRGSFDIAQVSRTDVAQPIAVTAGALNIPVMSYLASADTLSNKQIYPSFFRTISSDALRTDLIAKAVKSFGFRAVGLIYLDDAFGTAFRASLQTSFTAYNIRLIAASYPSTAVGDELTDSVRFALQSITDERIRIVYHAGLDDNFFYALSQAADDLDWLEAVYWPNRIPSPTLLQNAPNPQALVRLLQGSFIVSGVNDPSNPPFQELNALWPTFNASYVNQFIPNTTAPDGVPIRASDDYFQRTASILSGLRSYTLAYDSIMALGFAACGQNTSFVQNLASVSFDGTSGYVAFDSEFNRVGEIFAIQNIHTTSNFSFQLVSVGTLADNGNWSIDWSQVQFSNGTNQIPQDIQPPQQQIDQLTPGARAWGIIEAVVGMGLAVITLIYLVMHRKDKAIVESQPTFMVLLACGCFFMAASIIGLVIETDAGCMLFPWFFAFGFTLVLASLNAKSVRVAVLWYSRGPLKQRNHSVRATVLFGGMGAVMAGLFVLLIAWQIVAPLTFVITTTKKDAYDYPLYSSAMCVTANSTSTIFLALVVTYVCLVLFFTMWVSFWVRNAPEKFQEARMTAIAGVSMFQVFFVGIPTAAAVWNMALPRFLVLSSLTFLLTLIVLCTMFLPKVCRDKFGVEKSSSDSKEQENVLMGSLLAQQQASYENNSIKGVITVRGKKRRTKEDSSTGRVRSIAERVLESVQEVEEEEEEEPIQYYGEEQKQPSSLRDPVDGTLDMTPLKKTKVASNTSLVLD